MTNIAKKLKKCPKGTKLYSPICGDCELVSVSEGWIDVAVPFPHEGSNVFEFTEEGKFYVKGEVLLFPSKQNRDWSTFKTSCQFKPYDKIVARRERDSWEVDFFGHYSSKGCMYSGLAGIGYDECLPYNEETAKLIGTFDDYAG